MSVRDLLALVALVEDVLYLWEPPVIEGIVGAWQPEKSVVGKIG